MSFHRVIAVGLMGSMVSLNAARAGETTLPSVTVFGTAVKEVVPDELNWSLTVHNQGANLGEVAKLHAALVARVLELLKEKGIDADDTQTADMRFGDNWEYRDNSRVKNGYFATTDVSFKMTDLGKYRDVWMGLAEVREVTVESVTLDSSKRIETQNETRRKALEAARDKARDMAKTLGAEIGEPLAVEETQDVTDVWSNPLSNSLSRDDAGDSSGGGGFSPGRIPVRIRVKVSFRLVGNG